MAQIDVTSYGAVGDGTTDDTAAIQRAINDAGVGGTVLFPIGSYLVSSQLEPLAHQIWQGEEPKEGKHSMLVMAHVGVGVNVDAKNGVKFEHLTVSTPGVFDVKIYGIQSGIDGQETAINQLIHLLPDSGATLCFPPGNYHINVNHNGITGIVLKRNMTMVMADGCVIQAQPVNKKSVGGFTLIRCHDCYNVTIRGGILDGNRKQYEGAPLGESCMGIDFRGCRDVYVHDTIARNFIGDGFSFQGFDAGGVRQPGTENRNVWLINCQGIANSRTGVFFGGAIGCGVKGGEFRDQRSYGRGILRLNGCSGELTVTINGTDVKVSHNTDDVTDAIALVAKINASVNQLVHASVHPRDNKIVWITSHPREARLGQDISLSVTGTGLTADGATLKQYLPASGIHFENEKLDNGGADVPADGYKSPDGKTVHLMPPWTAAVGSVSKVTIRHEVEQKVTSVVTITRVGHGLSNGEYIETFFHPDDAPAYPFYSGTWDRPPTADRARLYNNVYQITVTEGDPDHFTYTDVAFKEDTAGTYTNTQPATIAQVNCWRNRDIVIRDVHSHHNQYGLATWGRVPERVLVQGGSYHDNSKWGLSTRVGASHWTIDGVYAYNNGAEGIKLGNTSDMDCSYIAVKNCNIYNNAGSGITVDRQKYVTVSGNNIHDNGEHGIWARLCFHGRFDGNVISSNGTKAADAYDNIHLYDEPSATGAGQDSSFNTFTNNRLVKGSNSNKPAYGVNVASSEALNNRFINMDWASAGNEAAYKFKSSSSEAPINVKDFGAVGDGCMDDTAAIQAAIDAISDYGNYMLGGTVYFPPGVYKVENQLIVSGHWGVVLRGAGKTATSLVASGSGWDSKSLLVMHRSMYCGVEDMQLTVDGIAAPRDAVYISSDASSPGHAGPILNISSRNYMRNVKIWFRDLASKFNYGIRIGGDVDHNNDFHLFENVEIIGCAATGFKVDNTQAVDHTLLHCFISNCPTGVDAGSFKWLGGAIGSSSVSDFAPGAGQSAGCGMVVDGGNSEGSARLLLTNTAPGVIHNISIRNFRWADVNSTTPSGDVIHIERAGNITIENCLFVARGIVPIIKVTATRHTYARISGNCWNTASTTPISPIDLHPYASYTGYPGGVFDVYIQGNSYIDAAGYNWPILPVASCAPAYAVAAPTDGCWDVGRVVHNAAATAGGNIGWVCTTAGRFGTYSEGRTATTDGTTTVTLNSASTELLVGDYVTIGSTAVRIVSISGIAVVVDSPIAAGGPGLAIAYTAPVFKEFGSITL